MIRNKHRVLWLEKLGALDVAGAALAQPFSDRVTYYGERGESAMARRILGFARRCNARLNLFPVSLSLEEEKPDARTLAYKVDEDMLLCGERFVGEHAGGRPLKLKNAIKCYMSMWLRERVAFAVIVESKAMLMRDKAHTIRFTRHPMNRTLCQLYKERGFVTKESLGILEYIRCCGRILKLTMSVIKARMTRARPGSNIERIRPSVWIEYYNYGVMDFAFWKKNVDSSSFDIVYYLDRNDTPAVTGITGKIEKDGALWVDAHLETMASNIGITALVTLIKDLLKPGRRPFWLKIFDFEYNFWLSVYTACFKKFKVKILIQHQDTSWKQEVQARAMEVAGGIMIGFHWSSYPAPMIPAHLFPFHLFFVWGKISYDFLRNYDMGCNYIFPSGIWIGDSSPDLGGIQERLKMMDFTLAIFDSSTGHNIHQTPRSLSKFFLLLLDLLEKNASWGAVVKNKSGDIGSFSSLPEGGDIARRFRLLAESNRVFFLNSRTSPATAAALADISVCYGLNSAGIIAGAYGHRTLHWDCSGWLLHPLYQDRAQKVAFRTLEEFASAITGASAGDDSIGDFSKWRRSFNHFDDFNADKRVGEFIQDIMDMSVKTDNARDALDPAAKKYLERQGVDFLCG